MVGLDHHLERWVDHHRVAALDPVFVWLTRFGSYGAVWLVLALALTLALRSPRLFLLVAAADLAAEGLADGLKLAIGRARPVRVFALPQPLVHEPHSSAFPSGHATTSFACGTMLSLLLPRAAPVFLLLAAAIAFSRVYVGVHWVGDVVAGAVLGALIALAIRALLRLAASRSRSARATRSG